MKPRFHSWTWRRSANPPVVNARTTFQVAAEIWYAWTRRSGSGTRASGVKACPLIMSPRYAGRVTPSRVSESELRGLAYCPAMRPIFTTGMLAPCVRMTAICRMVRILLRMRSAFASANVSAQSPPCRRNASPRPAAARRERSVSAAAGTTSGAEAASRSRTAPSAASSGHVGCWSATSVRKWSSPASVPGSLVVVIPRLGSVRGGRRGHQRLADALEQLAEPLLRHVERLAAGDARELDRAQAVAVLLVVADDAGLAAQRALDREVGHRLDEAQVLGVRGRGAREVAGLLDHDLLGTELLGELLREPLAGVDRVELDVAEGVALDLLARRLELRDDLVHARALGQEDVDVALGVHDRLEALGLGVDVDRELRQEHGVHVPALARQAEGRGPLLRVEPLAVLGRGRRGEPAAVAAHDLVHDEHARARAVLADDVRREPGGLLG